MKDWMCGECGTVRESKDNVIIFICPACVNGMEVEHERITELSRCNAVDGRGMPHLPRSAALA